MKSILDEMYNCDFFNISDADNAEQQRMIMERVAKAGNELRSKNTEYADVFEEYRSAVLDLMDFAGRNAFNKGFRAGAQLILEMLVPM